jgi:hypothetical protein
MYYNTADNTLYWWDGSAWVSARGGASATPPATTTSLGTIQLAGDLAGTATSPQIAAGVITDAEVASANKDGTAGTLSLRTLGAGAQQAMPGNRTLDAITPPTASLDMNGQRIINLLDPIGSNEAATKNYVDATAQGLDAKQSVKAATTTNIASLTGAQTIDGVSCVAGDRVLVKDQSTPSQNGIYVVSATLWSRASDTDTWGELVSAYTWVEQGTTNADSGWVSTVDQGGTLGSTAVTWTQFSGAGQITAGAGLTKNGNTLDVGGTANRITVGADTVDIAATYVGQASITTLGTIATGTWAGTPIALASGGTGQTTAKAARETGLGAAGYYSSATHGAGTTITITQATHGLRASRGLLVQVQDEATGLVELPDIGVATSGDVTVTYAASVSANSKRITIIG